MKAFWLLVAVVAVLSFGAAGWSFSGRIARGGRPTLRILAVGTLVGIVTAGSAAVVRPRLEAGRS